MTREYNRDLLFNCIVCGKEGKLQAMRDKKERGNCCSYACDFKRRTLDPLILKEHKRKWAKIYFKRPEIKKRISNYLKAKRSVQREIRLRLKADRLELVRGLKEQKKQKKILLRPLCWNCNNKKSDIIM